MATSNNPSPTAWVPTQRIEAFSDGVIAIAITVMVFDLKLAGIPNADNVWRMLADVGPKCLCYLLSFLMLGIMWVSHHQLFHQIGRSDSKLLWYNMHLLFWMSLVPFSTNFVGANPLLAEASSCYGLVFFGIALAFTLIRGYVYRAGLLRAHVSAAAKRRNSVKNRIAMAIYGSAALLAYLSVYLSFAMFLLVPAMYFIPERISFEKQND